MQLALCTYFPVQSGAPGTGAATWVLQPPLYQSGAKLADTIARLNSLPLLTTSPEKVACDTEGRPRYRILLDHGNGDVEELAVDANCGFVANRDGITRTGIKFLLATLQPGS
jgi:hypothetical protein